MRIAIGADHRGFACKRDLIEALRAAGHQVRDCGATSPEPSDYPDLAFAVGEAVGGGACERGILICGSGIGMSIAANKVAGVRAALCGDVAAASASRRHNDANVLCLSGDRTPSPLAREIADAWLATTFEGGRHARRVRKIADYETTCTEHTVGGADRAPRQAPPGPGEDGHDEGHDGGSSAGR
jgi:ribose 5-phosphate isomerase B